ncbi:MAG TPA: hypothetical protein VD772_10590, partial [Anseongella sp.]|nr:hypothetical protein [Anseongella sp.]
MDLEKFIPLIIIAAAYLFQAFESARKKKQQKPGAPPAKESGPLRRPAAPVKPPAGGGTTAPPRPPEAEWRGREMTGSSREASPAWPAGKTSRPSRETFPGEPDYREPVYREPAAPEMRADRLRPEIMRRETVAASDLINPEVGPEEVARVRKMRGLQSQAPVLPYREPEAEHEYADLDLEDAVIKSVILERREF